MFWIKLIIKYIVSCWITDILQNDTLSIQYQITNTTLNLTSMRNCPKQNIRKCTLKNRAWIAQLIKSLPNVWNTWVRNPPGAGMVSLGTTNRSISEHNNAHSRWTPLVLFPAIKQLGFYELSAHLQTPKVPNFTTALPTLFYGVICRQIGWGEYSFKNKRRNFLSWQTILPRPRTR